MGSVTSYCRHGSKEGFTIQGAMLGDEEEKTGTVRPADPEVTGLIPAAVVAFSMEAKSWKSVHCAMPARDGRRPKFPDGRSFQTLSPMIMKHKEFMKQPLVTFSSADRMLWCLKQTAVHFSAIYPIWVAAKFQDKEDTDNLRTIFDHVVATLSRDNRVNAGVVVHTHRLKKARLVILGDGALPTAKIPVPIGDTFLPNLALMIASRVGRVDHCCPAQVSAPAQGKLFESQSDYDPPWSANYCEPLLRGVGCIYAGSESRRCRLFLGLESWRRQLSLSWGAVGPYSSPGAWLIRHRHLNSLPLRTAAASSPGLFFRLAFFARCGESDARDECNDFARFAPELAAAYECPGKRKGVCEECAAAGRCESHLPQTI
ncbi:hypothetical protein HPB51_006771 [Rhipicephalus microplus]|uniref:Uncharacterized protein n=1 Tax=Rhipicephalus microplus TaxID=6941 RepID=A0A9J6E6Y5_RHIMP|nr:hypothetical protein HPB51_006771 [Rhipicephalus microplus]